MDNVFYKKFHIFFLITFLLSVNAIIISAQEGNTPILPEQANVKDKDKDAPIIYGVEAVSVSTNLATIIWTTDEPADSDIDYGVAPGLNLHGPADATFVTNHSISLLDLTPNTTYSYCLISSDESNNRIRECGHEFTTDTLPPSDETPPTISNIGVTSISTSSATITWVTDEIANAQVEYGTTESYGSITTLDETLNIDHSVILTGLSINTEYHFKIISSDNSGNSTSSADGHFSTLADSGSNGNLPIISAISPRDITPTSMYISWTTDKPADSQIEYGTAESYGFTTSIDPTLVLSHEQLLSNLSPDTIYHVRVRSRDGSGGLSVSNDYSFRTVDDSNSGSGVIGVAQPRSVTSGVVPMISNVVVENIKMTSVDIEWNTNIPATSQIEYGLTSAYKENTNKDPALVTNHKQTIRNLTPNTLYHFRVASFDVAGNVSYSIDTTFQTLSNAFDKIPPVPINDLTVSDIGKNSFTLSWTAPKDDTGVIFYDVNLSDKVLSEDNFYDASVVHENAITVENVEESGKNHSYQVVGLSPGKTVYMAIKSQDPFKNVSLISNVVSATLLSSNDFDDKEAPKKVSHVQAMGLDKLIVLSWNNPTNTDFVGVHIMRGINQYPSHPEMGDTVYEGKGTTFSDPYLKNGQTYYYSIFTYDEALNYSDPIRLSLAPYAERRHYHILNVGNNNSSLPLITKDFVFGDKDDEISHIQELLATDPTIYPEGLITGYFGPLTKRAVIRLQHKHNLPETGSVDLAVRSILNNLSSSQALVESDKEITLKSLANDLYFDMRRDEVKILQQYLEKQGLLKKGFITGYFGYLTKQAVINFQKSNNITPAVGYVGPITRAKILENIEHIIGIHASNIQVLATDLEVPWAIAFLPNGDVLATERTGNLAVIKDGNITRIPVEGVYNIAEGGLLGISLHPDFNKNNFLYLYMTYQENGKVKNKVERYTFLENTLSDKKIIVDNIPGSPVHNGGRIAFGPDNYLYITTGYADNDSFAQDTNSLAGKILRVGDAGEVPEDNPFQNLTFAYGFRNPQGLAWDKEGNLWATDHGRSGILSGFDEVNLVEKGKNYGWPIVQNNQPTQDIVLSVINSGSDKTWAPAGIVFVDGTLFFGGLRGQALYEAKLDGKIIIDVKEHFVKQFGRIRAVAKDLNNDIYFTTSNTDGRGNPNENDDKLIKLVRVK